MRTLFRSQHLDLPRGFSHWAAARAALLLGHHGRLVRGVVLHLSDVNGPRGGADIHCRAVARLRGLGEIATAGMGTDAGLAVEDCLARLERAVDRATRCAHRPGFDYLLRRMTPRELSSRAGTPMAVGGEGRGPSQRPASDTMLDVHIDA